MTRLWAKRETQIRGVIESTVGMYGEALPDSTLTVCRLHAGRSELTDRIMLRGRGRGSFVQPGDPLRGRKVDHLLEVADGAAREAEALERAALGLRIDTDGRTINDITDDLVDRSGWPTSAR